MRRVSVALLALALWTAAAATAHAQVDAPIGRFVADARLTWARFKEDAGVASTIGVTAPNLPTRGLGIVLGAHWYPVRGRRVALGIGGEFLSARDTRTLQPTTEGGTPGPTVETRFSSIAPQISLNFGRKDGWSYLSGGIGSASFTAERTDLALSEGDGSRTLNYGGGARWFTRKRLAVSVDLRFYSVSAQPAVIGRPAFPKVKMMVISGGIATR